jgi:membrane protein required for colicin V production
MNLLDWVIIAIVVSSALLAASQGFIFEILSLAGVVVGYLLAAWNYRSLAGWFLPYVKNEWGAQAAAFLLIFLAVCIAAGVLGRVLRWILKNVGLKWADSILGAVFGLLRGVIIVAVLLLAMTSFNVGLGQVANSHLAPMFQIVGRGASWVGPGELRQRFHDGLQSLEKLHAK